MKLKRRSEQARAFGHFSHNAHAHRWRSERGRWPLGVRLLWPSGNIKLRMVILNSAVRYWIYKMWMAPGLTPIDQSAARITAEQVIYAYIHCALNTPAKENRTWKKGYTLSHTYRHIISKIMPTHLMKTRTHVWHLVVLLVFRCLLRLTFQKYCNLYTKLLLHISGMWYNVYREHIATNAAEVRDVSLHLVISFPRWLPKPWAYFQTVLQWKLLLAVFVGFCYHKSGLTLNGQGNTYGNLFLQHNFCRRPQDLLFQHNWASCQPYRKPFLDPLQCGHLIPAINKLAARS